MARFSRAIHVEPLPEHFRTSVNGPRHKIKAMPLHSFEIAFNTLPDSSGLDRAISLKRALDHRATFAKDGPVKPGHDVCL